MAGLKFVGAIPSITSIAYPGTVGKYHKFEINFHLNPYDYEQIDAWAELVSPSGKVSKVYGFYYEGFHKLDDGACPSYEILEPSGEEVWKVRFSPQ